MKNISNKYLVTVIAFSLVAGGAASALAQTATSTATSTTPTASSTTSTNTTSTTTTTTSTTPTATSTPPAAPPPPITATSTLASCVKTAVIARENALIAAYDTFGATIKSALQTHRDALSAAWDLTDRQARNDAIHAADHAYKDAARQANLNLRMAAKAADRQFKMDRRVCTAGNDNGEGKDRGEHNGFFNGSDKRHGERGDNERNGHGKKGHDE